jgi:hypothetical protein
MTTKQCQARESGGYPCELADGHSGDHVVFDGTRKTAPVADGLYWSYRYAPTPERPYPLYLNVGRQRYWVELHALELPVVQVVIREATPEEPVHQWGWLYRGRDHYAFIGGSEWQVSMCFPYGIEEEVWLNRGRLVRLIVEETGATT